MSSVTSIILVLLKLVLFLSKSESQPGFTKQPPPSSYVVEGNGLFLQWNYTLGEALLAAEFDLLKTTTIDITERRDSDAGAFIYPDYQGRVEANITATQTNVTFLSLNRTDTGNYAFEVTRKTDRKKISSSVRITVQYPPEITSVSSDVVVVEGDPSVTLACAADGEPTPNITWIRVYDNGSDSGVLETGNQFVFESYRNNSGTYRCTAYNGIGTAPNRTVQVDVYFKPENVKLLVNDSIVCEGDVITITCSADGKPAVHTYQLYENGIPVVDGNSSAGVWIRKDLKGGDLSYRCVANNTVGTTGKTVNVTVKVPSKVYPLENITVIEGENRTLVCNVSGSPLLNVTWTEVSTGSQSGGIMRYLTNISRNDTGEYTCKATNNCGNSSASTFLTVNFKPENFKFTVSKSTVCQGTVVTFNCLADGNPLVDTYQLLENDTLVSNGSKSLGMWSRNMSSGGVFIYKCMANNSAGTAYSMSLTVTVNVPSSIQEILDQIVTEGNNLTLTCYVSGIPTPLVSWIKPDGQRFNDSVLELLNVSRNESGTYKCEASNECGNATEMASIDVQYKPENVQLMSSAMNYKACKGDVISFNCSADANPAATSYQLFENETAVLNASAAGVWSKTLENEGVFVYKCVAHNNLGSMYSTNVMLTVNVRSSIQEILDQNVTEGNNLTLTCNASGIPRPLVSWMAPYGKRTVQKVLVVTNISRNQSGEYKCEASNICGNATETATINVQYKPDNVQLMSSAMNYTACKGKDISFNCSADANPKVTSYQLFENGTAILNTSAAGMWSKTLENEGVFVYKCVANNSLGSDYSMNVAVTVNVPSSIIQVTQHQNATEGDNVTLRCNVSGVPKPTVHWMKPNGERVRGSKLEVKNVSRSEAGEYKCEASNECGNATKMTRIDVQFKPENVQLNSSAMDNKACKGNVISFNCSADAYPPVTSYQLFENETAIFKTNAVGMWSKTLENEGVFVYKCVANNSLGSEYSMSVTVTVNVPSSVIQITQDQNVTEGDNVTLMCNVSGVPKPTVYWMKPNGDRVSVNKLEVKNIGKSEAGKYNCEAINECGNVTKMTSIDVHYKPENLQFTSSAMDNKACKGDIISFNCSADARPSVTSYQLFENDTILDVNPFGTWTRNLSTGGVFMYKCVANNTLGSGVSSYVIVTVNVPSTIETIRDQNVTEGETVNLTCTASGMPQPIVSWIKPNGESVAGNVLELVNISRIEAEEYTCEASNECGNATGMAKIDVHYKPENVQLVSSAMNNKACKGEVITFNCSADAMPVVTSYQLYKNDTAMVANLSGVWRETLESEGVFVYKCVANNTVGSAYSADITFTVNVPPSIQPINNKTVIEGGNVTLMCKVSGMPPPMVSWMKPNGQRRMKYVWELVNISRNEAGEYKCEASNECDNVTEMAAIDVQYAPTITNISGGQIVNEGDEVRPFCRVEGNPAPTRTWTKVAENSLVNLPLIIRGAQDGGLYRCTAENGVGSPVTKDLSITVHRDFCEKPCPTGQSCIKFAEIYVETYVCSCPAGKTGTKCETTEVLKKNLTAGLEIKREFKPVYKDLENPETKSLVQEIETNVKVELRGTGLRSVKVLKLSPGSIIADLELTFNKSVGQSNVDALLKQATKDGKLGNMTVEKVVVGETFTETPSETPSETPTEDCGTFFEGEDCNRAKPGLIVLCVVGGVAVLAIIVAIIAYGLHRKKSDVGSFTNGNYRPEPVGTAGSAERTSPGNGYGSVNQGYQYDGTNGQSHEMITFKGTTPNPAQTPGITINDSSMTKKAQPGEGLYADLGEFHQKAPAPPTTPVKMPPEYERTEYAEITQFLRAPVKTDDEKENDEKEDESNVEKNSSPDEGEDPSPNMDEDPSPDMGEDPSPDMGEDPSPDMGEDPSPDMGDAGNRNSSGPVGFVVSI